MPIMKLHLLIVVAVSSFCFCDSKVFFSSRHGDVPKWKQPDSKSHEGKHWALIAAGSNGWGNYRHQANACHAYQIMKRNGIPEENIVLMMYDDIANNEANPTPGIIINHPDGPDVYKKEDVTPSNFLAVLSGNETLAKKGKKVIQSGPNDHIFVTFTDHGGPGVVYFPSESLSAPELVSTLKKMHNENKYKQMVIYMEACFSGSMFENLLPTDINIYATTSANPAESSYACYPDEKRNTYLGDQYSVNWMEDSDKENLDEESLEDQFRIVRNETKCSHVQEYGDQSISQEMLSEFQAGPEYRPSPLPALPKVPCDAVPADEVPLAILRHRLESAKDEVLKQQLMREIDELLKLRDRVAKTMQDIVALASDDVSQYERVYTEGHRNIDFDCYIPVVNLFDKRCFNVARTYSANKQMKYLVNMCDEHITSERIMEAIAHICKE